MEIEIAKNAGFCFGVDRAVNSVYELLEKKRCGKIYTLGHLIHNPTISKDLEDRGVLVIEEEDLERVFAECNEDNPCTVVVRAHGVTKQIYERLEKYSGEKNSFSMLDCACPYVKKIHKIVNDNADKDSLLYVFGDPSHPESKAIVRFAEGEVELFTSANELEKML